MQNTIDTYIQRFPEDIQLLLKRMRETIREEAPDAEEAMVYGIPTFKYNGNLVHFAAFKTHMGFYPTPSAIESFEKELSPYVHAKGSVQFPLDKPIPFDLIRRVVRLRVKENSRMGISGKSMRKPK